METWNDNLKRALITGDKPVVKAEMRGMSTAFLEVRDYTQGAGESFSVVRNGTTLLTLTEGVHFAAETSNAVTAQNIAAAILLVGGFSVGRVGAKLRIRGGGVGTLSMAVTSTEEDAWRQYRTGFPHRVTWCSDARACNGRYGAELIGMGSGGSQFDLETRRYQLATFDLTLTAAPGSWARALVTSVPVVGQVVELSMGTVGLAEGDYERIATMAVMDYKLGDSEIVLELAEPQVYAADAEVTAHFVAMHPLDIYRWAWEQTLLDTAFWDVPSTLKANHPTIRHWLVSAHSYHSWVADSGKAPPAGFIDVRVGEILDEVQRILPGLVRRDAKGVIEYLPFDADAARQRHFAAQDWESIEYETLTENRYTTVAAVASESELFGGDKRILFRVTEDPRGDLSAADEADDGRPSVLKLESRFFGSPAFLRESATAAATVLPVWYPGFAGISGSQHEDPAFTEREVTLFNDRPQFQRLTTMGFGLRTITSIPDEDISSAGGRVAWLLLTDGGRSEVVRSVALGWPNDTPRQIWHRPAAFAALGSGDEAEVLSFTAGTVIPLDTVAPFLGFPFVTFIRTDGSGLGEFSRNISAINVTTNTITLTTSVTVEAGQKAVARGALAAGGTYEIAYDIYNLPVQNSYFASYALLTVERGQLRTSPQAWPVPPPGSPEVRPDPATGVQVYDLTIAKAMCEMLLQRFRNGVPIARIVLGLHHGDIQEGDFVSFDDDRFLWLDHDGADSSVTWEVIGKRIAPIGDSPRVELTLAWVKSDSVPYVTLPDPTWEIPISTPIYPVPTIPSSEPYTDLDGAPFTAVEGGWYFPT